MTLHPTKIWEEFQTGKKNNRIAYEGKRIFCIPKGSGWNIKSIHIDRESYFTKPRANTIVVTLERVLEE